MQVPVTCFSSLVLTFFEHFVCLFFFIIFGFFFKVNSGFFFITEWQHWFGSCYTGNGSRSTAVGYAVGRRTIADLCYAYIYSSKHIFGMCIIL